MKSAKFVVLINVLFDTIGIGLVIPILPYYVKELGLSPFETTLLFAAFSLFSFFTSPLLGALSDRHGRKPIIVGSIIGTSVGWFIFAYAVAPWMLFLGRIVEGAGAGKISAAQSYLIDISIDEKDRASNLGLIGAAFGVGFILGPVVGAALSTINNQFPFLLAGYLAAANAVVAYFFLPESLKQKNPHRPLSVNPFKSVFGGLRDPRVSVYYIVFFLFGVAFVTTNSVFALYSDRVFGFTAQQTGMLFTATGLVVLLNQTVFLKSFWLKYFSEYRLMVIMLLFIGTGLLMMASPWLVLFLLALLPYGIGQAVFRVALTSTVSAIGDTTRKGERMGILTSLISASMVIAPIIAGALFELTSWLPFLFGGLMALLALSLLRPLGDAPQIMEESEMQGAD